MPVSAVSHAATSGAVIALRPSQQQLVEAYQQAADAAFKQGTAKPLSAAPAGASKAQEFDITKKNTLGVHAGAVVIKGQLYVYSKVVSPTAKASWYACGAAPVPGSQPTVDPKKLLADLKSQVEKYAFATGKQPTEFPDQRVIHAANLPLSGSARADFAAWKKQATDGLPMPTINRFTFQGQTFFSISHALSDTGDSTAFYNAKGECLTSFYTGQGSAEHDGHLDWSK